MKHLHPSLLHLLPLILHLNPASASTPPPPQNANYIFNAIHSSLRQWGSSLNHNGMSFFMASVPTGTHLYHGSTTADIPKGPEWLAFEPEHALFFAWSCPPYRPDRCQDEPPPKQHGPRPPPPPAHDKQMPLHTDPPSTPSGYLHTYAPTRPLSLLYIDGQSAGKTLNGTLDTQDFVLLNMSGSDPMDGELARARGLCDLGATLWAGKIDGVLRMEAGFEVILCEFDTAVVERVEVLGPRLREPDPEGLDRKMVGGWEHVRAVAGRYHGLGGAKATVDYKRFVSVFEYEGLELWRNDVVSDTLHPRLGNASPEQLAEIKGAVTAMVLNSGGNGHGRNWQEVADLVVERYSAPLHHLHTDGEVRGSRRAFVTYLRSLLRPYISASERDSSLELQRCVSQHVPRFSTVSSSAPSLAHATIHAVTAEICSTLIAALNLAESFQSELVVAMALPPAAALDSVDRLVDYLQWTTWKECGTCADEEVCFIPIWPMGSFENHKTPKCVGPEGIGSGYWGNRGIHGKPGYGNRHAGRKS